MVEKIVIVSVSGCPWCTKAIKLAEQSGYETEVRKMSWGPELREIQQRHPGWKTVPMVYTVVAGEEIFIGGYTDFENFVGSNIG